MADQSFLDLAAPARAATFIKQSGVALAGAAATNLLISRSAHAAGSETSKIGLIGCGGRGTGAVGNAFAADPNMQAHGRDGRRLRGPRARRASNS